MQIRLHFPALGIPILLPIGHANILYTDIVGNPRKRSNENSKIMKALQYTERKEINLLGKEMRKVPIEGQNLWRWMSHISFYSKYKCYIQKHKQRERSWFELWGVASCSALGVCKLESLACVMWNVVPAYKFTALTMEQNVWNSLWYICLTVHELTLSALQKAWWAWQ